MQVLRYRPQILQTETDWILPLECAFREYELDQAPLAFVWFEYFVVKGIRSVLFCANGGTLLL